MILNLIVNERGRFFLNTGTLPDYVMIHVCNKQALLEDMQEANIYVHMLPINQGTCFGMKIIWTTDIGENEIICTKGVRGSI